MWWPTAVFTMVCPTGTRRLPWISGPNVVARYTAVARFALAVATLVIASVWPACGLHTDIPNQALLVVMEDLLASSSLTHGVNWEGWELGTLKYLSLF